MLELQANSRPLPESEREHVHAGSHVLEHAALGEEDTCQGPAIQRALEAVPGSVRFGRRWPKSTGVGREALRVGHRPNHAIGTLA